MYIPDDLNNRGIRQLIEQFNAEETYDSELRSGTEELRKLIASDADLADLIAALRTPGWASPTSPHLNAIGVWVENSSPNR